MPVLPSDLRRNLENTIKQARRLTEAAAASALDKRGVAAGKAFSHFTDDDRKLRNRLRARGRQAGDLRDPKTETQTLDHLAQELAYEYWHRMLFARFLAENNLLMHPDGVAVSLDECNALAKDEGAANGFVLAARYASRMLPQIFRQDDVLLEIEFPANDRLPLEKLLKDLPKETFTADDSLGWVYQFWQSDRKDAVNASGEKITGDTISAVTQLFTEHYMVLFLLHNTIGAWHAGKQMGTTDFKAENEAECRSAVALDGYSFDYLRFVPVEEKNLTTDYTENTDKDEDENKEIRMSGEDGDEADAALSSASLSVHSVQSVVKKIWKPAAGTFSGWPKTAAELKVLDPCCGSGHFLVAGFELLVRLRMAEEGLSLTAAVDAVLADNLFGLELDPRCTQIAAFNLALAAWKLTAPPAYRPLPPLHIACSGIGPRATLEEWIDLAKDALWAMPPISREPVRNGLANLHHLFSQAPTLGSLINPTELPDTMFAADYETLQPVLNAVLKGEKTNDDSHERAVAAQGMAKAAEMLAGEYALVTTNVPYLGRGKQDEILRAWGDEFESDAKADLATMFVSRAICWLSKGGTLSVVTPQNWLFLTTYKHLRDRLLQVGTWNSVARLGSGAFETIGGEVVNVALLALSRGEASDGHRMLGIDAASGKDAVEKASLLRGDLRTELRLLPQSGQRKNPDARITLSELGPHALLNSIADSFVGLQNGDTPRFILEFWEILHNADVWQFFQMPVEEPHVRCSRTSVLRWEGGKGPLAASESARIQGVEAWGRLGVAVRVMGTLPATLYDGDMYDQSSAVIVPMETNHLPAIWCFCSSADFHSAVRSVDQKLNVTNATLAKVPFDLAHWQSVAAEKYPNGLPEPESDDPTQWLFHGRPEESTAPLQVAVARLLGYRWPAELEYSTVGMDIDPFSGVPQGRVGADKPSAAVSDTTETRPFETPLKGDFKPMRLSARAKALVKRCDELLPLADDDGIVCIPSIRGEPPAHERIFALLHAAYGAEKNLTTDYTENTDKGKDKEREKEVEEPNDSASSSSVLSVQSVVKKNAKSWSGAVLPTLLAADDLPSSATLEEWVRDKFFEKHCKMFHHRPFIWHIWDGRRDGFGALVNYHKLDNKTLESLTYAYLGDWISAQAADARNNVTGADLRLAAAQALQDKLKLIIKGESPYDIFVRWKPLKDQPIGWNPDLNDGVRMNIRPFMTADILRKKPNIKWTKDRGKDPESAPWYGVFKGERINDHHLTLAEKQNLNH